MTAYKDQIRGLRSWNFFDKKYGVLVYVTNAVCPKQTCSDS